MGLLLPLLIGLTLGYWVGWWDAHATVATDCRRVGSFYVGESTFKCEEVK